MNKVILMGRLTRDPEIRYGSGDNATSVARYTLAVDRRGKREDGQQTADFIGCVAFGKSAEFAEKYLRKGIRIVITGRIQTGSYTNRDGQKVYTTDVVVESQEFAESKASSENGGYQQGGYSQNDGYQQGGYSQGSSYQQNNSYQQRGGYQNRPAASGADGFMNLPDAVEDLPFS